MTHRRARIERVISGVLAQAFADARTSCYDLVGHGVAADFVRSLCERAGATPGRGLVLHTASKTELLLGEVPMADVLPLGDLYHSQLVNLIGPLELSGPAAELAGRFSSPETLDRILQRIFDDRMPLDRAAAELPSPARQDLAERLDAARFQRRRVGLVPKLGARTLGIDLYA